MVDSHTRAEVSDSVLSEQDRRDILRDGLKNVLYSRVIVYFAIIETVLVVSGYGLDQWAGPYSESTLSIHVLASILGVFAIYTAVLFLLYLGTNVLFTVARSLRRR